MEYVQPLLSTSHPLSHCQAQTVLLPNAKIVLDRFHIVQHMSRAMNRLRVQVMKQFDRKSQEYKAFKRYWKLIQQDSRKLSEKCFFRPTFRMHLTHQEIVTKLLDYSQELRDHYKLYQLLPFHFQEKQTEHFFDLINETLPKVNPIFQTVFRTFLKDKDMIINALEQPYSNAKLEATNNLIKVIKRSAFGCRKMTTLKKDFDCLEHQKGENQCDSLQMLAFQLPTTVDNEPKINICCSSMSVHYLSKPEPTASGKKVSTMLAQLSQTVT